MVDIVQLMLNLGIPSAVTGLGIWFLKRHIDKREKLRDGKEAAREEYDLHIIQSLNAALALGEATACAVARIPDAHCNGDMHSALEYARKIKHEQKNFLTRQGVENLRHE